MIFSIKNHINLERLIGRSARHLNLERLISISAHLILDLPLLRISLYLVFQSSRHHKSQTVRAKVLKFQENVHPLPCVKCRMSCDMCHMLAVMCQVPYVRCHVSLLFFFVFF